MMNQQPDKFFRDKLEQFGRPVPSSAWSKVESNLNKKNDKALWLRTAASLLLIGVASYLLWPAGPENSSNQLADIKNVPQTSDKQNKVSDGNVADAGKGEAVKTDLQNDQVVTKEKVSNIPSNRQNLPPQAKQKGVQENKTVQAAPIVKEQHEVLIAENNSTASTIPSAAESQPVEPVSNITTESLLAENNAAYANDERVNIVMSADEVNNKYLDKKSLAEATSDDKKPSTLRKLLDKAYDLKNNEDPFGDLRQKKNEILALNFRSDKQRSENK